MIRPLRRILDRIQERKYILLYLLAMLALAACLTLMIISKYSMHEKNMLLAEKNHQLVVLDLTSGQKINLETLLHKEPPAPAKTDAATTPTPPIKQADVMFIIDNLGGNKADSEKAIALPKGFMLAFSPYADLGLELSQEAKTAGHVTLADLPVQMKENNDAIGNLALSIENNDFKNSRNLEAVLSKVYQPSGVLTPANDVFTHSNNFTFILQELTKHKLFLAYAGEGEDIDTKAKDSDVGLLKIDIALDENDLAKQLVNVEAQIAKTGLAVVMIKNPSSDSVDIINKWAGSLAAKNIHLVSSAK